MSARKTPTVPPTGIKLLSRRSTVFLPLLLVALFFGAPAIYGLLTGDFYTISGRYSRSRHYSKTIQPQEYASKMVTHSLVTAVSAVLAFFRVNPVEDEWALIKRSLHRRMRRDKTPAPLWAYAFLIAFLGLILWIGWKTMYND